MSSLPWAAMTFKANGNEPLDDGVNRFIVNFSSVSAQNGNVGQVDYTAAKGAIESVTRTTAREFSGYRVRVNAIAPGPVNTPMLAGVGEQGIEAMKRTTLLGKVAEPHELAATVVGMACPMVSGYTTGQVFAANGGMYMASPVIYAPESAARNSTAAAMSAGVPIRFRGIFPVMADFCSSLSTAVISVSMKPGATTLTVIPLDATSWARDLANPVSPALAAA